MGKKILCENLPLEKNVRDLLGLLDPIGTVQWVLMLIDPETKQFTGQAYVEMWSDTEAELVISQWNGQSWEGKELAVRMVKNDTTPDAQADKSLILNSPPNYIYSVIRYQINAPPQSIVFFNDIPKVVVDDTGSGVVRALLPGTYQINILFEDRLLTAQKISVNCDEEPPRLVVTADSEPAPEFEEQVTKFRTGTMAVYRTQKINVDASGMPTMFMQASAAQTIFQPAIQTKQEVKKKGGSNWMMMAIAAVLLVGVGVGAFVMYGPGSKTGDPNNPPKPPITVKTPEGMSVIRVNGKFIIGRISTDDEYQKPAHERTLPGDYFMDTNEVTNEEYLKFVQETKRAAPKHWGGNAPPASMLRLPVTHVTWEDAKSFCEWRGTGNGLICRLPSEIEWEHAARGDKNLLYVWGNDWIDGNTNANQKSGKILPVGSNPKDVSPFGLFDMNGNVREWTKDDLSTYPNSKAQFYSGAKVARGGAFSDVPDEATSTYRSFLPPENQDYQKTGSKGYDRTGFRCMCEIPVITASGGK